MNGNDPNVAVIVASAGRPGNIAVLLEQLAAQTLLPAEVILSVPSEADLPPQADHPFRLESIISPRGSCVQRNRGLDRVDPRIDIVVFYDDDFVPSKYALKGMADFFALYPDFVGATGLVLEDGIGSAGISPADALAIVAKADASGAPQDLTVLKQLSGLYGCNMAFRAPAVRSVRFDENMPLYGWLEDIDFASRTGGRLAKTHAFSGVHCGEKRGRDKSARKLGYSQVVNPVYLFRKGSLPLGEAAASVTRNFIANHLKSFTPEPWVDRRARAAGNWLAIKDVLMGRIDPQRMLSV